MQLSRRCAPTDQPVTEMPAVYSVTVGGPAYKKLLPGDLVVSVDDVVNPDRDTIIQQIRTHKVGERIDLHGHPAQGRDQGRHHRLRVEQHAVGITLGPGYRYAPQISFDFGQRIGGPSAGLVFALAIYDKITDGALLGGRHVAGTGSITPDGEVGAIGGIQEKIAGAEKAGATVFLVPAGNCDDVTGVRTDMTLVKVDTLTQAVSALETLNSPDPSTPLPAC